MAVRLLVEAHPATVRAVTRDGLTPLFCAFETVDTEYSPRPVACGTPAGPRVLDRAAAGVPSFALQVPGLLPAHYAAMRTRSLFALPLVVEHWPDALGVPSLCGDLPIHLAVAPLPMVVEPRPPALQVADRKGWLPFQLAATKDAPLDVVIYLVSKWT
jgi:hypothetical protein